MSEIQEYIQHLTKELRNKLHDGAQEYLQVAFKLFHEQKSRENPVIQPVIGNFAIAIELMLKAYIAERNPILLFTNLPMEIRVLFACPESVPNTFNWRSWDIDIRSFMFKTIELDECISLFYIFFPEFKQQLIPYLKLLSRCRNCSVHSSLPSFHRYEMERTAFLGIQMFNLFENKGFFKYSLYDIKKLNEEWLKIFEAEKVDNLHKKIEQARKNSKSITGGKTITIVDEDWEMYVTECPICGSEGVLVGYTNIDGDEEEDGTLHEGLTFSAAGFECSDCGLSLDDVEELRLAGMETVYDRSDELEKWHDEMDFDFDSDYDRWMNRD